MKKIDTYGLTVDPESLEKAAGETRTWWDHCNIACEAEIAAKNQTIAESTPNRC